MSLKYSFFILCFLSLNSMASTIKVEYGFNIYSLELQDKSLAFIKKGYRSVVENQECSKNLFLHFSQKFKTLGSSLPADAKVVKKESEFPVKYQFENKHGELDKDSETATKLLVLPQEFENLRLAVEYRCEGTGK